MMRRQLLQRLGSATALALIVVSAAPANAQEVKGDPPFQWDSTFATPNTAVALEETNRTAKDSSFLAIFYRVRATGFAANEPISLWVKRGVRYLKFEGVVSDEGVVQFRLGKETLGVLMVMGQRDRGLAVVSLSGGTKGMVLAGFTDGHPLDVAVVSDTMKRAQSKIVPMPNRADGTNGCSASAEVQSESGLLFLINVTGLTPGETVKVQSQYKKEVGGGTQMASPSGTVAMPILFGRGDRGTASFTATSDRCTVKLEYKVGTDAILR
jgi:hypothetical protein